MKKFITIWIGQLISSIGSGMTAFKTNKDTSNFFKEGKEGMDPENLLK